MDEYRYSWSRTLRRVGFVEAALALERPFQGSFLHWRWETLATVCAEITRLRWVLEQFFQANIFGPLEDSTLLGGVQELLADGSFLVWTETMGGILAIAERARKWGSWCPCHAPDSKEECSLRSRRLHQAQVCKEAEDMRGRLDLQVCEGHFQIQEEMSRLCSLLVADTRLRFDWLTTLPYLFANITNPDIATQTLEQWAAHAEHTHHRVTRRIMHALKPDIVKVSAGGAPPQALRHEKRIFRLVPLSEASIEGYHAQLAREVSRAHSATLPCVFAKLRAQPNFDRIRVVSMKPGGRESVAFEFNRYKRILQTTHTNRSRWMKYAEFRSTFYRLRDCAVGSLEALGSPWVLALSPKVVDKTTMQLMRHEFLTKVLKPMSSTRSCRVAATASRRGTAFVSSRSWHGGRARRCWWTPARRAA